MAALFHKIPLTVLAAATVIPLLLSGCHEADTAIDFIVGKKSPAGFFSHSGTPLGRLFASTPGETRLPSGIQIPARGIAVQPARPLNHSSPSPMKDIVVVRSDTLPEVSPSLQKPSPGAEHELKKRSVGMTFDFTFPRDPFMPPSEAVLPTECLPSMPLCRYDYTQLKLRGLIRLANGQYKGMVEDPDGRGFFITPGTQIRGATVTQVTADGVILYIHKSKKVDWIKIEGREAKGY